MKLPATPSRQPTAAVEIVAACAADAEPIRALLDEAELPSADFAAHLAHFVVARHEGRIVGAVGAEVYGSDALLRSFVVAPALRGSGVGERLLAALDEQALRWGVCRWWLLTTTAEAYFKKRGFNAVERSSAPGTIASTTEFRGLCPSVARCLTRELVKG